MIYPDKRDCGVSQRAKRTRIERIKRIMIQIENSTVNIYTEPHPKKWIKRWHAFGLFFAVSNTRLKKRDTRPYTGGWKSYHNDRNAVWEEQGHKCPICGTEFESHKEMEAHHALPWARFPELRDKRENLIMLCHKCHKEIHCNPYKNIQMMESKAKELGIDLNEKYSI